MSGDGCWMLAMAHLRQWGSNTRGGAGQVQVGHPGHLASTSGAMDIWSNVKVIINTQASSSTTFHSL